ncbi:MAG: lipoate--protein ligase family protein [Haloarculaceae archaeon]
MHVYRGRATTPAADRSASGDLLEVAAERGVPAVRVWYPPRQVAFGRRDRSASGYDRARALASRQGYPPTERRAGGHPVAFTGNTLAFALVRPADELRTGIGERYEAALEDLTAALEACGVAPDRGEPPGSFCPGSHSLSADGKVAGLAQRVRADVASVAGVVVARDDDAIATVLDTVYDTLDIPFDPNSVGSVAGAGGDPFTLRTAVEDALVGDAPRSVRQVR